MSVPLLLQRPTTSEQRDQILTLEIVVKLQAQLCDIHIDFSDLPRQRL